MKSSFVFLCFITLCSRSFGLDQTIWPACQFAQLSEPSAMLRTVAWDQWTFEYSGGYDALMNILGPAQDRFLTMLKTYPVDAEEFPFNPDKKQLWQLDGFLITIEDEDAALVHGMVESYELKITPPIDNGSLVILNAGSVYGVLRAFQTFLQLLDFGWMDGDTLPVYTISTSPLQIVDAPEYPYRGLMIDTSRHYLPLDLIHRNLHAMEINKLNVLHWHLTDSQSWPYDSAIYPELSRKGAYCRNCTYSIEDIRGVIQAAALRGIRVIVEVDLPGHSQGTFNLSLRIIAENLDTHICAAIGASHPEWMTDCGSHGPSEPLDVTKDSVYDFVQRLYDEIVTVWPDNFLHVGGDEVRTECWKNSSEIQRWMKEHNMTDEVELLHYFENRLLQYVTSNLGKRPIAWQELFDSQVPLPNSTIVDVWKSWETGTRYNATALGFHVIFSACWYLDHLAQDWADFYRCDPRDFRGSDDQKLRVIGGHACMWGETVDEANFMSRVWPRASAAAEKLWTGNRTFADRTALSRMIRFQCWLRQQGIDASPIVPGSCMRPTQASDARPQRINSVDS